MRSLIVGAALSAIVLSSLPASAGQSVLSDAFAHTTDQNHVRQSPMPNREPTAVQKIAWFIDNYGVMRSNVCQTPYGWCYTSDGLYYPVNSVCQCNGYAGRFVQA